jgi:four helix bundle protein
MPNEERMRKGDDIAARRVEVVAGVRRMLPALQADPEANHVGKQLWRAVTGGGANYEEARAAESIADFVHKLRVATKELRETLYWLRIVQRCEWAIVEPLINEVDQLIAILVASARTTRFRHL